MPTTEAIKPAEYVTDAVTAERIFRGDYHWGYRMSCADCGYSEDRGRHTTVFDKDIPVMFAANHEQCGSVAL